MASLATLPDGTTDLTWDETHRALVPLLRADNHTNIGYLAGEYAGLLASLAGCIGLYGLWSGGGLTTPSFLSLAVLGAVAVAVFQHRLSGLGHEASHYALFKNRLANELASDLLCMFPLMAMTQRFRATHLGHHQFLNDTRARPGLCRGSISTRTAIPFPMSKATVLVPLRGALAFWPPSPAEVPRRAGEERQRDDRLARAARRLSVPRRPMPAGSLLAAGPDDRPPDGLVADLLPVLGRAAAHVLPFYMQLREIAHHSNAAGDGEFAHSRNFHCNPILNWAVFPYGQDYHLTHHVFGLMPHYNLARAHEILLPLSPLPRAGDLLLRLFLPEAGRSGPFRARRAVAARTGRRRQYGPGIDNGGLIRPASPKLRPRSARGRFDARDPNPSSPAPPEPWDSTCMPASSPRDEETLTHRLVLPRCQSLRDPVCRRMLALALEAGYAAAFRAAGLHANLVLKRVLDLRCYEPVPVGQVIQIRGREIHRARAQIIIALWGSPLIDHGAPLDGRYHAICPGRPLGPP